MRKFRVGDRVRFRRETRVRPPSVEPDEVGDVIYVEDVPQTGPTYKMCVRFPHYENPALNENPALIFKSEFELVEAVPVS